MNKYILLIIFILVSSVFAPLVDSAMGVKMSGDFWGRIVHLVVARFIGAMIWLIVFSN